MAKRTLKLLSAAVLGLVLGATGAAGAAAAADVVTPAWCSGVSASGVATAGHCTYDLPTP